MTPPASVINALLGIFRVMVRTTLCGRLWLNPHVSQVAFSPVGFSHFCMLPHCFLERRAGVGVCHLHAHEHRVPRGRPRLFPTLPQCVALNVPFELGHWWFPLDILEPMRIVIWPWFIHRFVRSKYLYTAFLIPKQRGCGVEITVVNPGSSVWWKKYRLWSQISNHSFVTNSLMIFVKPILSEPWFSHVRSGVLLSPGAVGVQEDAKWALSRAETLTSCSSPLLSPVGY